MAAQPALFGSMGQTAMRPVTSAQSAGRGIALDLSRHLNQTRYSANLIGWQEQNVSAGSFWLSGLAEIWTLRKVMAVPFIPGQRVAVWVGSE